MGYWLVPCNVKKPLIKSSSSYIGLGSWRAFVSRDLFEQGASRLGGYIDGCQVLCSHKQVKWTVLQVNQVEQLEHARLTHNNTFCFEIIKRIVKENNMIKKKTNKYLRCLASRREANSGCALHREDRRCAQKTAPPPIHSPRRAETRRARAQCTLHKSSRHTRRLDAWARSKS